MIGLQVTLNKIFSPREGQQWKARSGECPKDEGNKRCEGELLREGNQRCEGPVDEGL